MSDRRGRCPRPRGSTRRARDLPDLSRLNFQDWRAQTGTRNPIGIDTARRAQAAGGGRRARTEGEEICCPSTTSRRRLLLECLDFFRLLDSVCCGVVLCFCSFLYGSHRFAFLFCWDSFIFGTHVVAIAEQPLLPPTPHGARHTLTAPSTLAGAATGLRVGQGLGRTDCGSDTFQGNDLLPL